MGSEFPVDFERAPIELFPCLECSKKLLALFAADRAAGASTYCVDRHSSRSVEEKLMTTRDMTQLTMLVLEIRRLELKSHDHGRDVEMMRRPHQCRGHVLISHDSSSFQGPRLPRARSGSAPPVRRARASIVPRQCQRQISPAMSAAIRWRIVAPRNPVRGVTLNACAIRARAGSASVGRRQNRHS